VKEYTLDVSLRAGSGSSVARRLREEGLLPSVVYGHFLKPMQVQLSYRDFMKKAETARMSQVFTLKSEATEINGTPAIVKEIQRDHISGRLLHVDFQALREDEEITVQVPVEVTGEAYGVKTEGGILSVATREISVACLPKSIPESVQLDITELKLGESVHARDLQLPGGVKLAIDPDETIVSVVSVRVVEETPAPGAAAAAAGAAAGAEGAAAAPAEGAEKKEEAPGKK